MLQYQHHVTPVWHSTDSHVTNPYLTFLQSRFVQTESVRYVYPYRLLICALVYGASWYVYCLPVLRNDLVNFGTGIIIVIKSKPDPLVVPSGEGCSGAHPIGSSRNNLVILFYVFSKCTHSSHCLVWIWYSSSCSCYVGRSHRDFDYPWPSGSNTRAYIAIVADAV